MVKLLESYGYRIQKSAFEGVLTNKNFEELVEKISKLVHPEDVVKIYQFKGGSRIESWGNICKVEDKEVLFI